MAKLFIQERGVLATTYTGESLSRYQQVVDYMIKNEYPLNIVDRTENTITVNTCDLSCVEEEIETLL